jgi:hypothetical protein
MKNNVTFSAYYRVPDNAKYTAELGHVRRAKRNPPDYFISDQYYDFTNSLYMSFNDLPSLPYLTNLRENCLNKERVFTKAGYLRGKHMSAWGYFRLATIWTSKLMLFETIAHEGNFEYVTWVDCINRWNFEELMSVKNPTNILIGEYASTFNKGIFGGAVSPSLLPKQKLLGSVIKIPTKILPEVIERYKSTLQQVDRNFEVYDDEIVLSVMNHEYPELFTVLPAKPSPKFTYDFISKEIVLQSQNEQRICHEVG